MRRFQARRWVCQGFQRSRWSATGLAVRTRLIHLEHGLGFGARWGRGLMGGRRVEDVVDARCARCGSREPAVTHHGRGGPAVVASRGGWVMASTRKVLSTGLRRRRRRFFGRGRTSRGRARRGPPLRHGGPILFPFSRVVSGTGTLTATNPIDQQRQQQTNFALWLSPRRRVVYLCCKTVVGVVDGVVQEGEEESFCLGPRWQ